MGKRPELLTLDRAVAKARAEAVEALRSWEAAKAGDSNDAELEAGQELAWHLQHAYSITHDEITEED